MKTLTPPRDSASAATPYETGYGRPPVATRFQPGQSGNPKGRPRQLHSARTVLEQALLRKVRIIENGLEQRLDNVDVLFRSIINRAIKGDNRATVLLVQLMEKWQVAPPQERITEIKRIILRDR